jgi:formate dehydrogenase (coenzyme F420) beta subunit
MAESVRNILYETLLDTEWHTITTLLREQALKLLRDGRVSIVLGYTSGWNPSVATPTFVTDIARVPTLILSPACTHNLARYLVGCEGLLTSRFRPQDQRPKVAIVARPATLRAIAGLIREHQLVREDLVVLGVTDGTLAGVEPDIVLGEIPDSVARRQAIEARIAELEQLPPAERWQWWHHEFAKCTRCYACRQVCPFCYCEQCIADQNQPQWIERSSSPWNNRVWNMVRALHLVGRCVDCGECERVCPAGIPLSLLNTKMALKAEAAFGFVAGTSTEGPSVLFGFERNDPDSFIR